MEIDNNALELMHALEFEKYKNKKLQKQLDEAYKNPNKIQLWSCIKHKLFGYCGELLVYPGVLGAYSKYESLNKNIYHLDKTFWCPKWLRFCLETISLETHVDANVYGEKFKRLVIKTSKHIILFYIKQNNLDRLDNYKYNFKIKILKNTHMGTY